MPAKSKSPPVKAPRPTLPPLWSGPGGEGPNGGVSQSLLSRYLQDKERFRIKVIEGLVPKDGFSLYLEFGQMWHLCEEYSAKGESWDKPLLEYARELCRKYPNDQMEIDHWHGVVKTQFPEYLDFWSKHRSREGITPVFQEWPFDIRYRLPSGRTVRLRGKIDGCDLVSLGGKRLYGFETKTKGDVDEGALRRQLLFDLQTMMYLTVLHEVKTFPDEATTRGLSREQIEALTGHPLAGVRYNVVRRACPIRRHKAKTTKKGTVPEETREHFYSRLRDDYLRAEPASWFVRFRAEVSLADITRFRQWCLDPILENLCDDYEWWEYCYNPESKGHHPSKASVFDGVHRRKYFPHHCPRHFVFPYGVRSFLTDGGEGDVDDYMWTGSTAGLTRAETLFRELTPT